MKKIYFAFFLLALGLNVQAQEATLKSDQDKQARAMELMSEKVDIKVDENLFMAVTPNTYVSESPKAVIMAMKVPESYAEAKKKINDSQDNKFKVKDRGEKTINGVNVLFMEGTSEAEGVTLNNTIYCVAIDENTCLMFIGMVEVGADAKYIEAITEAANSVIKK